MSEGTTNEFRLTPGATLDQWTDAEWGEFTDSLTWENFQLDKEAGQDPRFVVLSSSGKPIFATSPEISHLEEK